MNEELNEQSYVNYEDLSYYDKKIKDYVDSKITESENLSAVQSLSDRLDLMEAELTKKIQSIRLNLKSLKDIVTIDEKRIDEIVADLQACDHRVDDLYHKIEKQMELIREDYVKKLELNSVVENIENTYATKQFVSEEIDSKISDISGIDLSTYAKKSDLDDLSSEIQEKIDSINIPSIDGLATEEYVQEQLAAIPEVDLSGYAKKEDIPDVSSFISSIPEEYVTEAELDNRGYLTNQDLSNYVQKSDLDGYITKDSGVTKEELQTSVESQVEQVIVEKINNGDIAITYGEF